MRILFLNDLGFQYGAGIAMARQIESLLLGGHTVAAVCGADGGLDGAAMFTRTASRQTWRGLTTLGEVFRTGASELDAIDAVVGAVAPFYPDVVVTGNLHGGWPLAVLPAIDRLGCRVVAYMHDMNFATARCVQPMDCEEFIGGCTADCPTARDYPALEPARIHDAWLRRQRLFNRIDGIELATNSGFMRTMVERSMPSARVRVVPLGADAAVFHPGDRAAARAALGLPDDRPIVLTGSVNLSDRRKGAQHLPRILARLGDRARVVAFGYQSNELPDVQALGYRTSPRELALAFQAADVFLGTSAIESFGQTILEAALSSVPSAAFAVGGIPEIVESGGTGLLVPLGDVDALADAALTLVSDAPLRTRLGAAARRAGEAEFSLERQLEHWSHYLGAHPPAARSAA